MCIGAHRAELVTGKLNSLLPGWRIRPAPQPDSVEYDLLLALANIPAESRSSALHVADHTQLSEEDFSKVLGAFNIRRELVRTEHLSVLVLLTPHQLDQVPNLAKDFWSFRTDVLRIDPDAYHALQDFPKRPDHEAEVEAIEAAIISAEQARAPAASLASLYFDLGNRKLGLSRLDQALNAYERALGLYRTIQDSQALGHVLGNIGLIHQHRGDLEAALRYNQDALKIHREIGNRQGEANQLGNIGTIFRAKGDLDPALRYGQAALKIHREIGDRQGEANQLGNIGNIYHVKGDLDAALRYHQDALKIHREIGYLQGEADQLGNIGNIQHGLGDPEAALRYHLGALKIHREIGYHEGIHRTAKNIAKLYEEKHNASEAAIYRHLANDNGFLPKMPP